MKPNPAPNPDNVHVLEKARFQWLTPAFIRLEWDEAGVFEDRASFAASHRHTPRVDFEIENDSDHIVLRSSELEIHYRPDGQPFHAGNLEIQSRRGDPAFTWKPGQCDIQNLGGTVRTLDMVDGDVGQVEIPNPLYEAGAELDLGRPHIPIKKRVDLGEGLLSRAGWSLMDDSGSVVLDPQLGDSFPHWVTPRQPDANHAHAIDWYFLGYGLRFQEALADAAAVFGRQPLPPRYALGYWWSRYWAYSDREIEELVDTFDAMDVPLDVMVVDMDWHLLGWTGYTWDRHYFPDPGEFLANLKERGLRITLNLHPADGVGQHEEQFTAMAEAMGLDPAACDRVPFDITDPQYMRHYFEILHHPDEARGVDFWWMDWQQGESTAMPGLDTLPWINQLHWEDMEHNPQRNGERPLIFSRYGGLGAGRYCIGFSGDTFCTWESLQFQPHFTATAANVLYGYWSHDIGGHQPGPIDGELYTRWMQLGAHSPILRTHTSKHPEAERRFWEFPDPYQKLMTEVVRKRYEQVPYIYTECRNGWESGLSLCRPLYHEHPDQDEAYQAPTQFYFGSGKMVAPVLRARDPETECAAVRFWLPEGEWIDTARGARLMGNQWHTINYLLEEIPVFVRPGAILPATFGIRRLNDPCYQNLRVEAWAGGDGEYTLYEDDGVSDDYRLDPGHGARLPLRQIVEDDTIRIEVGPFDGRFPGFEARRNLELCLHGIAPPAQVEIGEQTLSGPHFRLGAETIGWRYIGDAGSLQVRFGSVDLTRPVKIRIHRQSATIPDAIPGIVARLKRITYHNTLLTGAHPRHPDERIGIELSQIGNRISRRPETCADEWARLRERLPAVPGVMEALGQHRANRQRSANVKIAIALAQGLSAVELQKF